MIIVEPHVTRGRDEVRCRAEVLAAMSVYHAVILQPADLADLGQYLDQCERDCREFMAKHRSIWPGLSNVIIIGHLNSPYVAETAKRLAPGESVTVLPLPYAWEELHKMRDQILAKMRATAMNRSVH